MSPRVQVYIHVQECFLLLDMHNSGGIYAPLFLQVNYFFCSKQTTISSLQVPTATTAGQNVVREGNHTVAPKQGACKPIRHVTTLISVLFTKTSNDLCFQHFVVAYRLDKMHSFLLCATSTTTRTT